MHDFTWEGFMQNTSPSPSPSPNANASDKINKDGLWIRVDSDRTFKAS